MHLTICTDRTDRTDDTNRTDRTDRTERTERTECTERTERTDGTDRTDRMDRTVLTDVAIVNALDDLLIKGRGIEVVWIRFVQRWPVSEMSQDESLEMLRVSHSFCNFSKPVQLIPSFCRPHASTHTYYKAAHNHPDVCKARVDGASNTYEERKRWEKKAGRNLT